MYLSSPANVQVNVFRGYDPGQPYPPSGTPPAAAQVEGLLRPDLGQGRLGEAVHLHWTHVLELPLGTDIRCGCNTQLQTWDPDDADTVILPEYPIPGWCTAFLVVLVQRVGRGGPTDRIRAYLDRALPQANGCFSA